MLINYILDLQGMDLRIEHSHGFSKHGDGGHYHYDTTPEEVEYLGYFVLGESEFSRRWLYDPPKKVDTNAASIFQVSTGSTGRKSSTT